jgi:hypothetical protein
MTSGSNEKGTISVQLVGEALFERRRQGLADAPLLEQAGIAPAQLQRPYARVSAQAYAGCGGLSPQRPTTSSSAWTGDA